jgi:hypothetical protein
MRIGRKGGSGKREREGQVDVQEDCLQTERERLVENGKEGTHCLGGGRRRGQRKEMKGFLLDHDSDLQRCPEGGGGGP